MPSVLFVCTANRCRSPIAMALFRQKLQRKGAAESWTVESAGTWTEDGYPVVSGAKPVLEARGLDLSEHRSRGVTGELLRRFEVILTMERGQKEALQIEFPEVANRIYMLSEMGGIKEDIRDPQPMEPAEINAAANHIEHFLDKGYLRITRLATQTGALKRS